MRVSAEAFFRAALAAVDDVGRTQLPAIREAADVVTRSLMAGGVGQVFGTGHSRAFAMEMANRAGGLVPMHAMSLDDLALRGGWALHEVRDPTLERRPEVARELLALYDIEPADAFVIVSSSGRNGSTVEMALAARESAHPVIAVTSMHHSRAVDSRHPSGKRLYEVADVVIDNRAPFGDAVLDAGDNVRVCAVSSITGAFIAQALTAEILRRYQDAGRPLPVLVSANIDGADQWNERLRDRYAGRISRL